MKRLTSSLNMPRGIPHKDPERSDILSVFVGIRPLIKTGDVKNTAKLSREHVLLTSKSGLVTITGGNGQLTAKWLRIQSMKMR